MLHFNQDDSQMMASEKSDLCKQTVVQKELRCESQELASFDEALQNQPNDYIAWFERGKRLDDFGSYELAVLAYQKALDIKPDFADAWNCLGAVLGDHLERYQEALICFNEALKLDCSDDFAWYNRGNILEYLERYEDAVASYELALNINPQDEATWYGRGWALYQLGHFEDAIASYDRALELKPTDDSAWYTKACCFALLGRVTEVIECLIQAVNLSPNQYPQLIKTDEDFDEIRSDARFKALMQELLVSW